MIAAIKSDNIKCMNRTLDSIYTTIQIPEGNHLQRYTPLMFAARHGSVKCLHELLQKGVDIDGRLDGSNYTALNIAAEFGHVNCVKALINAGANLNNRDTYSLHTPLLVAINNGHNECVEALIDAGCDLSSKYLLSNAANNSFVLKKLLDAGVYFNYSLKYHPLLRAITLINIESVKLLLNTWDWSNHAQIIFPTLRNTSTEIMELVLNQYSINIILQNYKLFNYCMCFNCTYGFTSIICTCQQKRIKRLIIAVVFKKIVYYKICPSILLDIAQIINCP